MNTGSILIIDDDEDDLQLFKDAFQELEIENEIILFRDGFKFLDYMNANTTKILFILCDINLQSINGLELKRRIFEDDNLRPKCVPFLFISTSRTTDAIMKAYSFGVQGYFIKPNTFSAIKEMALAMVHYWRYSQHPNH